VRPSGVNRVEGYVVLGHEIATITAASDRRSLGESQNMARLTACIFVCVVLAASTDVLARPVHRDWQERDQRTHSDGKEGRDRWKWWLYDRAELGITDRQSADIDRIFESTMPAQRAKREELERLEAQLAVMTSENKADVTTVQAQVDKVENLRAEMNKTRTVMLYRINLILSPEQRVKVRELIEKRRNSDSSRRR
jgi:Spy/CpxP family protein refolding chaperone